MPAPALRRPLRPAAVFAALAAGLCAAAAGAEGPPKKAVAILKRCVACHSGESPGGGLNLTDRTRALAGGEHGPAFVIGKPADSLIYKQVAAGKMPPKKPLSPEQVEIVKAWLEAGAAWDPSLAEEAGGETRPARAGPDWWSLQPVVRPVVPAVADKAWVSEPIDAFILAELEKAKLRPAPPAPPEVLIRRVTFDLIGLPPTPGEIDAFVAEYRAKPQAAYEALIDRLLASPHYGERWGRHWLDAARFGESQGFERDKIRDHAWRYRDYVIRSFNQDKPYPQFVREQLAGDVLEPATREGIIATGFLTAGPWDEVGQTQQSVPMRMRVREEELEDLVSAVGQTFLGLTVNCARCHNHKFDPIPQRDYYRLKAVFEGVRHGDRPTWTPAELAARDALLAGHNRKLAEIDAAVAEIEKAGRAAVIAKRGGAGAEGVPLPVLRWSFDPDAREANSGLKSELVGGAKVADGRLKLDGKGAMLRSAPIAREIKEKTLEAWVRLADLKQRGGGVLSIETPDGKTFDAIVFGEREGRKWLAGSDNYSRTMDLAGPAEDAKSDEAVHIAVTYGADNRIKFYRNGAAYGASYVPGSALRTYPAGGARVLIGLRHTGAGNGLLAGEVDEARVYDRALTAAQVAASFRGGAGGVSPDEVLAALTDEQRSRRAELLKQREAARAARDAVPAVELVYAANVRAPDPTYVLARGDIEKRGELVGAAGLSAVKSPSGEFGLAPDAPDAERRRKFADWVAHPDNPLAGRVMVNRIWQHHFGRGLVASPNDFGFNGDRPTHPALLDWLAAEFAANGGRVKALHRRILLSSTYRQSATFNPAAAAVDADNRLLWRFPPRRLEAEAVRDAMLAVSGELNPAVGGPGFRPFNVKVFNSTFYDLTDPTTPEFNRRTVYRINVNSAKSPLLETLDCPDPSVKTPRRSVTTTPLQALALMNNPFVLRQAKRFAERVSSAAGDDPAARIALAWRLALGRVPTDTEAAAAGEMIKQHGLEQLCWVLLNANEFLYVN